MSSVLKQTALAVLDTPAVGGLLSRLRTPRCAILMLHRFATPDGTHIGHDPTQLRSLLSYLRASGVDLLYVDDAMSMFLEPEQRPRQRASVAFTVDDGYADLVEIAAPIFEEFDCPVTAFVCPDVLERRTWYWWDEIDWIVRTTDRRALDTELRGEPVSLRWETPAQRQVMQDALAERLKRVSTTERVAYIRALASAAEVSPPEAAPSEYRVLDWDELRAAERRGLRFGPHTMSHPILSQCDDAQARHEIVASSRRVAEELLQPSKFFCYPNGTPADFGEREMSAVREAGMRGALGTSPALLRPDVSTAFGADWRWKAPRFAYDERRGATARQLFV